MSNEMQLKLIQTYAQVCSWFNNHPHWEHIRLSNNRKPSQLTDQEVVTIYLFVGRYQKYTQIKDIHSFACHYLYSWFPKLTSYAKFNHRLNLLYPLFYNISLDIMTNHIPENAQRNTLLLDSMPIVTCKSKNRTAKVATGYVDKGFCSTKNMYYYGLKLHLLAFRRKGSIPFPSKIHLSAASENDVTVVKEQRWLDDLHGASVFADKSYSDKHYFKPHRKYLQLELFTPVKDVKGMPECLKQRDFAANKLLSTAISKVRQPIEVFFNWLIEKSNLQNATKVRSANGLWLHCFGKLAIAILNFIG